MSATLGLTRHYSRFFGECLTFGVSPYTNTFMTIAEDKRGSNTGNVAAAALVCGLLTFAVPVLPLITAFTATLAAVAMCLALASMCVTYPIALLSDACDDSWLEDDRCYIEASSRSSLRGL